MNDAEEISSDDIPMAPASIPLHPALKRLRPPNSILDAENVSNFHQTPRTVRQSVAMWGPSLEYVRPEFIDYALCKRAIEAHDGAIAYVPRDLLSSEEYHNLCVLAVSLNGFVLKEIPRDAITAEIVAAAHEHTCCAIMFTPREFLTEELCWKSIERNGDMIEYVPAEFQTEDMRKAATESSERQRRENSARAAELTEQLIRDGQISCPVQ
jgi:hypothetical protein